MIADSNLERNASEKWSKWNRLEGGRTKRGSLELKWAWSKRGSVPGGLFSSSVNQRVNGAAPVATDVLVAAQQHNNSFIVNIGCIDYIGYIGIDNRTESLGLVGKRAPGFINAVLAGNAFMPVAWGAYK